MGTLTEDQKEALNVAYKEFLNRHWMKGAFGTVLERVSKEDFADIKQQAINSILKDRLPENDSEFMERIGSRLAASHGRITQPGYGGKIES